MRWSRKAVVALTVIALAGCGEDSVLGVGSGTIAGAYTLRTINGNNLPFTIQQIGADKTDVLNEALVLADSTVALQGAISVTEAGVTITQTYSDDGTFTRNGSALVLTFNSGLREAGTASGGTITLTRAGFTLVYRR